MADKCSGLVGEALEKCRSGGRGIRGEAGMFMSAATESIPRWMGAILVLFGILIIWQPNFLGWIVGAMLILMGVLIIFTRKTVIIPVVLLIAGVVILLYPAIILYALAILFIVVGLVMAIRKPTTKLKQGIGLAGVVIGLLFLVMPNLLGIISGVAIVVLGFVVLMGGLEEGWG